MVQIANHAFVDTPSRGGGREEEEGEKKRGRREWSSLDRSSEMDMLDDTSTCASVTDCDVPPYSPPSPSSHWPPLSPSPPATVKSDTKAVDTPDADGDPASAPDMPTANGQHPAQGANAAGKAGEIAVNIGTGVAVIVATPFALVGAVLFGAGAIIYGAGKLVQGVGQGLAAGPEAVGNLAIEEARKRREAEGEQGKGKSRGKGD